jgi:hypothetical protein
MPLQVMADYGHGDNAPMLFVELRLSLSPFVPHSYVRVKMRGRAPTPLALNTIKSFRQ